MHVLFFPQISQLRSNWFWVIISARSSSSSVAFVFCFVFNCWSRHASAEAPSVKKAPHSSHPPGAGMWSELKGCVVWWLMNEPCTILNKRALYLWFEIKVLHCCFVFLTRRHQAVTRPLSSLSCWPRRWLSSVFGRATAAPKSCKAPAPDVLLEIIEHTGKILPKT